MELNEIPQQESKIFQGQKKVVYATNNGLYQSATSNGWETEEYATEQAVQELNQLAEQALKDVNAGLKSPLFYYMYLYRFDLISLSQATGIWQWRIKRHFKPTIFANLSEKTLAKYAEVFQLSISQLKNESI